MYTTYKEIYERYLEEATKIAKGVVLKTDCHNESGIYDVSLPIAPYIENCYCIEIHEGVIELAKKNFPDINVKQGDIRYLDFTDKFFDTIIDLSTIDHIHPHDIDLVLRGYKRLCKGDILMVVRTNNEPIDLSQLYSNQYYFEKQWFKNKLEEYFTIDYEEELFELDNNILILYRLHGKQTKEKKDLGSNA